MNASSRSTATPNCKQSARSVLKGLRYSFCTALKCRHFIFCDYPYMAGRFNFVQGGRMKRLNISYTLCMCVYLLNRDFRNVGITPVRCGRAEHFLVSYTSTVDMSH